MPTEAAKHAVRDAPAEKQARWSREVSGSRRGASRRAGIPRGTPHDALVEKVLERMMIDQARRIAF